MESGSAARNGSARRVVGLAVCTKIKFITIKSFAIRGGGGGGARIAGNRRAKLAEKASRSPLAAVCAAKVKHRLSSH